MYSEYNLHISRNHSWQWILENAHYISCLFFYLCICIREWIWIYRRSILFVYMLQQEGGLLQTELVLPYLILQISEDKSNQFVTTIYTCHHSLRRGITIYYFLLIHNKILFFLSLFFGYFQCHFKWNAFLYYQALIKKNIGKYTTSFKQNLSLVIIRASNILITYESKLSFSRYDD